MTATNEELLDAFCEKETQHRAGGKTAPRGVALERLLAASLEQFSLPANPENMARMRGIYLAHEFGVRVPHL